ncbi:MAG: uroporphyrinogen decarboxylase family protein [Dehalococcoidales bacterium]|jgi:uroporphyrinogen decarboxylase|nr:uroporphyrinogen decarboxylase family protein [Dehalococcoidales bacterium]
MKKNERIKAALAGEPVDRPPVALWRHWPMDDQDADLLAERALDFQQRYDWDFIKIPPSSSYCIDDYGAEHKYLALPSGRWLLGERTHQKRVIQQTDDWDAIKPLDIHQGTYGRILQCLKFVIEKRDPDIPVIQTVFNPIAMARYMAGDDVYLAHLRRAPEKLERALKAMTETCADFVKASIAEGADGIFMSTSAAGYEVMSVAEHDRFCRPCDLEILEAAGQGWFNMLHVHGQQPMFAELADYPVQVINWHDRSAGPGLKDALGLFKGALAGGVEQYQTLQFETPREVTAQVHDAVRQTRGRRLIVSAGCTYPITVPEGNILAVRRALA